MRHPSIALGAIYTTFAMAAVALMAVVVKWGSHGFSSEFLMLVRFAAGLAVFVPYYFATGRVDLRSKLWLTQSGVAISWTIAIFLYYVSLRYVPLMDATLLLNTSALFAPLLAFFIGRKHEPWQVWAGTAIGFVGVLIVLRPGADVFRPMSLLALGSGMLMAVRVYLHSRVASEPRPRTTFYSLAVGLALCVLLLALTGFRIERPAWEGMLFTPVEMAEPMFVDSALVGAVFALGLLAMLQPLFVAASMEYATVGQVSPFRYTAVVIAAALDWMIWGQAPTWIAVAGMLLIALGAAMILSGGSKSTHIAIASDSRESPRA